MAASDAASVVGAEGGADGMNAVVGAEGGRTANDSKYDMDVAARLRMSRGLATCGALEGTHATAQARWSTAATQRLAEWGDMASPTRELKQA
mmetsp:Transcript_11421/g.30769  ORF Transcript_11421/g.30769 Transcript_11421/m.30769 type:complete len:92 (+) Transcript_11421:1258-1533(+)